MSNEKQIKTAESKPAKLSAVPFVMDGFKPASAIKAWKSKPSKSNPNPTRIGAPLGTITFRIAGSAVTFQRDVQIRFENDGAEPSSWLDVPYDQHNRTAMFVSDSDTDSADLARFWADARDKAIKQYVAAKLDEKLDLATVDYKTLSGLVKSAGSAGAGKIR